MKSILLMALVVCAPVAADENETPAKKATNVANETAKKAATDKAKVKATTKKAETKKAEAGAATAKTEPAKKAEPVPLHKQETMQAMLKRNNELRQSVGLSTQKISPELTRAAQGHAQYMARTGAFDHYVNGNPRTRAREQKYTGWVSENIARGQTNVSGAFRAWKRSSGHWANIRSSNSEVGFGYAKSPGGMAYWVTLYGTPAAPKSDAAKSSTGSSSNTASSNYSTTRRYTSSSNKRKSKQPFRTFARKLFGK